ncbi:hypothetical protein QTH87_22120 [Variovorax sp. J22P168]|uniref:PaaI family thioesterase n=1 Tax=Variovorax jilinensis TaxID=3053513 RepID=UPI00257758DA|nr:acyl-CoA thioesterase domain-containing protein [Variovorax sp. J22P168]MDM0015157.1 hypothetical protein [Variovorax sp. J22P168]
MTAGRVPIDDPARLPEHGGFYPAGDPALHLRSMAYPRALDLRWNGQANGRISILLPFGESVLDVRRRAVDPLAILGALDHACSAGVYAGLMQAQLIATVDLRVEFADQPTDGNDVMCEAWTVWSDAGWALTRAEARCASTGAALAFASSAYAKGSHPGAAKTGAALSIAPPPQTHALLEAGGFAALLGLQHSDLGTTMPFREALVGAQSLPSLHGGSTAAALGATSLHTSRRLALDAARPRRLLSVAVQFLRAAGASATSVAADIVKSGARIDVLTAIAHQGDLARPVARAECVVAIGD